VQRPFTGMHMKVKDVPRIKDFLKICGVDGRTIDFLAPGTHVQIEVAEREEGAGIKKWRSIPATGFIAVSATHLLVLARADDGTTLLARSAPLSTLKSIQLSPFADNFFLLRWDTPERGSKPPLEAPSWVSDKDRSHCTNKQCGAKFSVSTRRHHCRGCGDVFCNKCTATKRSLPDFGYGTAVRVCDKCSWLWPQIPYGDLLLDTEFKTEAVAIIVRNCKALGKAVDVAFADTATIEEGMCIRPRPDSKGGGFGYFDAQWGSTKKLLKFGCGKVAEGVGVERAPAQLNVWAAEGMTPEEVQRIFKRAEAKRKERERRAEEEREARRQREEERHVYTPLPLFTWYFLLKHL